MRRLVNLLVLSGVACGGPAEGPNDPGKIEVPAQPPQVLLTPGAPDAGLPIAEAPKPIPFSCPTPGIAQSFLKRDYCAYPDAKTWTDAEHRCVSHGGHLVSMPTRELAEVIRQTWGNKAGVIARGAWIGLEIANKAKKQWKWSNGEPVKLARWNDGEPNDWDGNEGCGELLSVNGKWNDTRCNLEQGFLCQRVAGKTNFDCTGAGAHGLAYPPGKYCYVDEARTHAQAKKACDKRGGALAVLSTEDLAKEVDIGMKQRFEVPRFWIGLNDLTEQGIWMWPDGSRATAFDWKPGEPNNFGREGCVELHTDLWQWNDLDCNAELPSLCEGPAPQTK